MNIRHAAHFDAFHAHAGFLSNVRYFPRHYRSESSRFFSMSSHECSDEQMPQAFQHAQKNASRHAHALLARD